MLFKDSHNLNLRADGQEDISNTDIKGGVKLSPRE
jgi:hypothetical protein